MGRSGFPHFAVFRLPNGVPVHSSAEPHLSLRRRAYLLKRPVGRPPSEVRRYYANFSYQAQSWKTPRRVVAKVEWHPGELYPRVGFIVTNMTRPAARVVAFYNKRGTCEQWIKEGKGAIKWTRLYSEPMRFQHLLCNCIAPVPFFQRMVRGAENAGAHS
jgi:hypothetical protein